jgi:hypothetical protein
MADYYRQLMPESEIRAGLEHEANGEIHLDRRENCPICAPSQLKREPDGAYLVLDRETANPMGRVAQRADGWHALVQEYAWGKPLPRMRRVGEVFRTRREAVDEVEINREDQS